MLDTISDLVGKVEKIARKPWVTQEMMSKMEERRKWKNVNNEEELYDRPDRPETLEVEPEEEVDTDEKGPYILQSEVEKAIKEMRKGKATGDDDVPGDVLKLLGEGGLKTLTKLMNTIHESGEWPKDFTEVTMIALKKNTKAAKCSDHRTISLIEHTARIIAKILKRRI
ncbi:hypothetical protein B7P43_G15386 [Cryptotermes secundus]|uniref:Reverse transcriptase domain-containing protein n=1 Tax=Cryptotermes secundus TaxID=105785 RepID=A0A2J7PTN2_9NEOP|nr:hypothetical protein B7P43_G15386 [Cryptotermes secundus]